MSRSLKLFVIVLVVLVVATLAYAFAAANTVPRVRNTTGDISGYTVSNIAYTFDTANPSNLIKVAFSLDAPATTVSVSLTPAGLCKHVLTPVAPTGPARSLALLLLVHPRFAWLHHNRICSTCRTGCP
jgi:hypothetical protein